MRPLGASPQSSPHSPYTSRHQLKSLDSQQHTPLLAIAGASGITSTAHCVVGTWWTALAREIAAWSYRRVVTEALGEETHAAAYLSCISCDKALDLEVLELQFSFLHGDLQICDWRCCGMWFGDKLAAVPDIFSNDDSPRQDPRAHISLGSHQRALQRVPNPPWPLNKLRSSITGRRFQDRVRLARERPSRQILSMF